MSKNLKLIDNINNNDSVQFLLHKPGFKTKVIAGYDPYKDKNGVTQFGEVLFHGHIEDLSPGNSLSDSSEGLF